MGYSLLLIEDASLKTRSLYYPLSNQDQTITMAHTPQRVSKALGRQWPDVIVLNLLGGRVDPIAVNKVIAKTELCIPRLVLSNDSTIDNLMAEAVIYPPYTSEQLEQQIKKLADHKRFYRAGKITVDTEKKSILRDGVSHKLTPKLFNLLTLLVKNEGEVVYRKTIMKEVWQTEYMGDTRTLDVHIRWIREKIEDDPSRPKHLKTVRGLGYCFVSDVDE